MLRMLGKTNALALLALVFGVFLTSLNVFQLRSMQAEYMRLTHPELEDGAAAANRAKYVVFGKNIDSGYLKHVYRVRNKLK